VTIVDLSKVWVVADVYERELASVHVGDEAIITTIAYPGRSFRGRVAYVGDQVDPATRAASARVELDNADIALRAGMFASIHVQSAGTGCAQVPTSALLAHRDQFFVFVADPNGTLVKREVHVGEQWGQHATILFGLVPGEMVVTEGAVLLDAEANEAI
jgi:Cu(I)/Ag(I) efflux system membrane fusion protein